LLTPRAENAHLKMRVKCRCYFAFNYNCSYLNYQLPLVYKQFITSLCAQQGWLWPPMPFGCHPSSPASSLAQPQFSDAPVSPSKGSQESCQDRLSPYRSGPITIQPLNRACLSLKAVARANPLCRYRNTT
jgi:hypothetical protein